MSDTPSTIRLYGMVNDSIVDGPGYRFSVFTQGCPHHCEAATIRRATTPPAARSIPWMR